MSEISLKSITGITSITTPSGVDNQLTVHNNNTTEAVKFDNAGNVHINNQLEVAGVSTFSGGIGSTITIAAGVGSTAITLDNSHKMTFGSAHELEMYHDGSNSYIKQRYNAYPSQLNIISENSQINIMSGSGGNAHGGYENAITCHNNGAVKLYHAGVGPHLETNGAGITVQANIQLGDKLIHNGDNDTCVRFPTHNTISAETTGSERVRIAPDGKVGIGTNSSASKLDVYDTSALGIISRSATTQATDTNKALKVRNNSTTDVFSVSYKGFTEIKRGELGMYLKVGGDDASNGRALTFTSSNTQSNGALHTIEAISGNGAIALATAGTERFRVDRNGYVTKPYQPAFSAQGDSSPVDSSEGYTGILSNYMTVMECNVGGHYKTSGTDEGKFVAPVAGNYFFSAGCLLRLRSGTNGSGELTFHKNGSNISARSLGYSFVTGSNDHDNVTITAIISLAAGDKVHLVSHACSGNLDWYWGEGLGNFNGFLIG